MSRIPHPIPAEWREIATERQLQYVEAFDRLGSQRLAAQELEVSQPVVCRALNGLARRAARNGSAPGHFDDGVAPGYRMGKVTVQRANGAVERTWERQLPEAEDFQAFVDEAIEGFRDAALAAPPAMPPPRTAEGLCAFYLVGDPHAGLRAWEQDTGTRFDLEEWERVHKAAIDSLVASTPPAETAVLIDMGDTTHADNSKNRTPRSGHYLQVDAAQHEEVVRAVVRVSVYMIERLSEKHARVIRRGNPGNHDLETARALAIMLEIYYKDEPRVEIASSSNPFWYFRWGRCLVGTTHGDGAKMKDLGGVMASDCPKDWGETIWRWWFIGHWHHATSKDYAGVSVEVARTLAANDSHHHRDGYRSLRSMECLVLDREGGRHGRFFYDVEPATRRADQ